MFLKPQKNNLPAFTIVESIVALVIILLSFGTGMMIYLNVLSSQQLVAGTTAHLQLTQVMNQTKSKQAYFDETLELGDITIEKKIIKYPIGKSTYQIHLLAFNNQNTQLAEISEIIQLSPIHE